ncbi:MAG: AmmeMemoRadiSam system protein A [Gammaproteobacteria bacterium]|nr:AmmeMemoRadiSam system protein A [Gammaproteobacteria bacterium]
MALETNSRERLLQLARQAITHQLNYGEQLKIDVSSLPSELKLIRATFVTLTIDKELRGCIGMIDAVRELAVDVAYNAHAAAFRDPRFTALTESELPSINIEIAILSPMESINCEDEAELIAKLNPGIDGLLIADGMRRATFLPKVWEQIPDRSQFIRHLKAKAGFASHYWSSSVQFYRYRTETFQEKTEN